MKKLLTIFLTITLFVSCSDKEGRKEKRMRQNIESKLKPMMNDPASYEFVSMTVNKTITVGERKEVITEEHLKEVRDLNERMSIPELLYRTEAEYDFLKNQPDNDMDAVYFVDFVAKGTNIYGGVIQSNYSATVINDDELTVINLKKDK